MDYKDFNLLYGNKAVKHNLYNAVNSGKLNHAIIIEGVKGSGRHTLANLIAQALVCVSNEKPCGECKPCQKAKSKAHPDIINITIPESKATIGVDIVRGVRSGAFVMPNEADRKVYIINSAEKVTFQAQNALLNILEEPPSYANFILILETGSTMLPTVQSRCIKLTMSPVSDEDIYVCLTNKFPKTNEEKIKDAVKLSKGIIGRAEKLIKGDENEKYKVLCDDFLEALTGINQYNFIRLSDKCAGKDRDKFSAFLNELYIYFRDIAMFKLSNEEKNLCFYDRRLKISSFSDKMTSKQIVKLMDKVQHTRQNIELNCNLNISSSALFAKCWEEVH